MNITIKKYRIVAPDIIHIGSQYIWRQPQAIPFEALSSNYEITRNIIEGTISVNFRVELDDPLNYISASGSIELDDLADQSVIDLLDLDDLQENVLMITINVDYEDYSVADFLGIVDPKQSYYDNINQTYHLYFYDLFSYVYNSLPDYLAKIIVDGTVMGDSLPYYIELSDGDQYIPLDFFLRTYNSVGNGTYTDLDISFSIERLRMLTTQVGNITINNFLDQVRNHYGAYAYIDGSGQMRLISRNRGLLNVGALDITEDLIEEEYTENYTMPAQYNAVRCSAIINDPEGTTIIDHLIYYDGEVKHKFIYSDTSLSSYNYLDLRTQIPGGISALYLFANRSIDDLKIIYGDITKPQNIVKCTIARIDLPILRRVIVSGEEYIIMNMEKFYEEEYSVLELLRK